ncbi:hypothetical protein DMUE_5544 [Dictyocoela muelleri]|nr:hypothetical protein DMUE_5544 [Dictyocoela muelleri]
MSKENIKNYIIQIKTQKNKPKIIFNYQMFTIKYKGKLNIKWRCKNRKQCNAQIVTDMEYNVISEDENFHTCLELTEADIKKEIKMHEMRIMSSESYLNTTEIISEAIKELDLLKSHFFLKNKVYKN